MQKILFLVLAVLVLSASALAQDEIYVPRYAVFGAFSAMESGKLNLFQRGFDGDFGVNVNRWLSLGVDFSTLKGHSSLSPDLLAPAEVAKLAPFLPLLPPGFVITAPYQATTYTIAAGPQFNLRKWRRFTLFARPGLGGLHESVHLQSDNPIINRLVTTLVGPSMQKEDLVLFYGFGGGIDIVVHKHLAIRLVGDYVHTNLFKGLLKEPRNAVRFSMGPSIRWGEVR